MPITHHANDLVFRARRLIEQVSVIKRLNHAMPARRG